jgi:hypothetical protein
MERSPEIALARLLRFQPREIAQDLLLPARNQRFPAFRRSRIPLQRRLEPRRHGMLRAVPVVRIEAELTLRCFAARQAQRVAHLGGCSIFL